MPVRATKRGAERTPLERDWDVVICGASFAGLTVARELRSTGARVLLLDRYEIGERQTSACAAPSEWLERLGLAGTIRQTFDSIVCHTPRGSARWPLPYQYATFDYPQLCAELWAESGGTAVFETAKVDGRSSGVARPGDIVVSTDRGDVTAPLVVDALGWRRILSRSPEPIQPPKATLSRGLEVHPSGTGPDLEIWVDRSVVREGYGWSFPAGDELRIGIGSYDPEDHVKQATVNLSRAVGPEPEGYQGNWIPHRIRAGVEGEVFFVGDSAGHCIPLSAEGIRTAFYFGIACGRELRAVLEGRQHRTQALARYGGFTADAAWKFEALLRWQQGIPRLPPALLGRLNALTGRRRLAHWAFGHYRGIAPPEFAEPAPPAALGRGEAAPTPARLAA